MLRTRRFKALNGEGKYTRIVDKIAIYDEKGNQIDCCIIQKDKKGREYYCPSNPHGELGLFIDRPKDAIECIRNGFADAFYESYLLGMKSLNVVRYIDRVYGEEIRQKTIDGWKDAKFCYGVKFCFLNAITRGNLVTKNKELMGYGDTQDDVLTFETEKEASSFIDEVNTKAKEYLEKYHNLELIGDKNWDYENTMKPFFNKIRGDKINSVYWNAFKELHEEERDGNPTYKMKIVQLVVS